MLPLRFDEEVALFEVYRSPVILESEVGMITIAVIDDNLFDAAFFCHTTNGIYSFLGIYEAEESVSFPRLSVLATAYIVFNRRFRQ